MIARTGNVGVVALVLVLAACGSGAGAASTASTAATSTPSAEPSAPVESAGASPASAEPTDQPASFPIEAFSGISEDPVSEELAAALQTALSVHDVTGGGGMSATVMTPQGTWSGTTGKADGVRDLQVDDQFAIASITKSVVAAQVMLMVEAGELGLDDLVADHLPGDLQFDTNEATIRHLLSHRSGIPDYYDLLENSQQTDFKRVWTPTEILELLPSQRTPAGRTFSYAETNYLLLKLAIEHLRGRPLANVLREGALAVDGLERLVHQPDESPTEPMAMPAGASNAVLERRGGYLPSLASATAYNASGALASDAPSLARWWRALCAGKIVSQASLTEMSTFEQADPDGYGLGMYNPAQGYGPAFGHTGQLPGYMSWAACLPEDEAVIVVLTNHEVDDGHHYAFSHGLARPLVDALRSP
jgi:D-alanyl-D-alanine carboxypeptidase